MRKKMWILGLALLSSAGCSSMNNTQTDTLVGAGAGAGTMALLTRGNPVATVFGGLVGGLFGNSVGRAEDHREDRDKYVQAAVAAQAARQMKLEEVVQLAQQHQSDAVIINQINATGSVFAMTADDINYLKQQGVSDSVVNFMISRRTRVIYAPGPYGPPPPVVYGPPPSVGVVVVGGR